MSVFKSFSKVLSQATLNSQKKTYILNQSFGIKNPVLSYLNQTNPPKDAFQLSLLSYHYARKNQVNTVLLQRIEANQSNPNLVEYQQTLANQTEKEYRQASEYADLLTSVLKSGVSNLPVNHAIKALYAYEATNKTDLAFYDQYIFSIIKEKIEYASLENLIELADVLSTMKYFEDKELWSGIMSNLTKKFDRPAPKYVKLTGWETNAYEEDNKEVKGQFSTETEKYFRDLSEGNKYIANFKQGARCFWDIIQSRFLYKLFFKEGNLTRISESFPEVVDREKLKTALEGARSAGINIEDAMTRLRLE